MQVNNAAHYFNAVETKTFGIPEFFYFITANIIIYRTLDAHVKILGTC